MARNLRWTPDSTQPHHLFEVTARTVQSRMLLLPGRINPLIYGCMARAQEAAPEVGVCGFSFMSNHYHGLFQAPDAPTLSYFMNIFQGTLAKEVCRLHDWGDHVWARRYSSILVSEEPEKQIARMRYLLEQGCKENLVASPMDWPGANSHHALANGRDTIQGQWIDRTELYYRRRRGEEASERDVRSHNTVHLSQLPAFAHLSRADYAELIRDQIKNIEQETRQRHRVEGTRPLGAAKIYRVHPYSVPETTKRSPAPRFHASAKVYKKLQKAYGEFVKYYRALSDKLRAGDVSVTFPRGCFPPPMAPRFVSARPRAPG